MARLLAAEHAALGAERFEHVAVADLGRDDPDPALLHQPVEAEVRHLGHGDQVDAEVEREDREDLVPVDGLAGCVDREHAVAVAVERDAEVGAAARGPSARAGARSVAPQPTLMFVPSGSSPIAVDVGAEPGEGLRGDARVGAVRAVDDDAQTVQLGAEALETCSR